MFGYLYDIRYYITIYFMSVHYIYLKNIYAYVKFEIKSLCQGKKLK